MHSQRNPRATCEGSLGQVGNLLRSEGWGQSLEGEGSNSRSAELRFFVVPQIEARVLPVLGNYSTTAASNSQPASLPSQV